MPNGHNENLEEFTARRESEGTDKDCLCPHCGFTGTIRELVEHHNVCPALTDHQTLQPEFLEALVPGDTRVLLKEEEDGED